jgi:prepilin signal peptidase PulO-like enzyme (type II secretory pathway)
MLEQAFTVLFAAILGACLGSFANVVAIRLHDMSSLMGRSHCPACRKTLRPRHMVPIFSWLALRGKCADCGAKIHVQYPLVEATAAALTIISAIRFSPFGSEFHLFYFEIFISIALLVMVVMDLRWKELPVEVMSFVGIIGAAWRIALSGLHGGLMSSLYSTLVGVAVAVAFFGFQWLVSKGRWLGSGDIWFGAMMGLVLGWPLTGVAIYLAYIVGGLGAFVLFVSGVVKRGSRVPFAPALSIGLLISIWFGGAITAWLNSIFV